MEQIIELAGFIATGAAWGMLWLAGLSLIVKSWSNPKLLQVLIYIFMITAGITAFAVFKDLYAMYSMEDSVMKDLMLSNYKGRNGWILIFKLIIIASPVLFLLKPVKTLKILVALVALCYVLLPYCKKIFDMIAKNIS